VSSIVTDNHFPLPIPSTPRYAIPRSMENFTALKTHLSHLITKYANTKNKMTPPQNIHLSCLARLSTILIVSPEIPSVVPTSYNLLWVPFKISLCWPKLPSTSLPLSKNSSICSCVFWKKLCSRRAWASRFASKGEAPKAEYALGAPGGLGDRPEKRGFEDEVVVLA